MTRTPKDLRELAGLYALDALEPHEAEEFERFLQESPEARHELEEFHRTAAALAGAEAAAPPPGLKARVMAEIDVTRQERPRVVSLSRRRVSVMTVAAAAALVLLAGLSVLLNSRLGEVQDEFDVLAAADAVTVSLDTAATPNLRVVWSPSLGEAAVVTGRVSVLEGEVYELWHLREDGAVQPIGIFDGGEQVAVFDTSTLFDAPDQFAITIEPPGGSPQPTGDIIAGPVAA